jgi:large subunit ribosomal protein L18
MAKTAQKTINRQTRHKRIRSRVSGTAARPRIAIFRSNTRVFVQVIDDVAQRTLASVSSDKCAGKTQKDRALTAAKEIAAKIKALKTETAVFDRGGYLYTGTIAAFADAVRAEGIAF